MPLVSKNFSDIVTFTRASSATFTGSNGLIQSTPQSKNLFTYSEQFDNAAWTKQASTTITANSTSAPDGLVSADTYTSSSSTTNLGLYQLVTGTNSTTYTASIYVKAGTASILRFGPTTNAEAATAYYDFNLSTETVTSAAVVGFTSTSATITAVGSGWYRCIVTGTTPASGVTQIGIFPRLFAVANIFIWGVQLEVGSTATSYTRNDGGLFPPRFDYDPVTLAAKGLLIEEQRTNLFVRSEEFNVTATWTPLNLTVTANTDTAPNGTLSADTLTATAANAVIQQAASVTNAAVYTYSVWIKRKTGTGAVTLSDLNGNYFSVTVDATWTRFSLTSTAASTTGRGYIRLTTSGDEVYVWGAQLEAGSFPTSYIPTVASQVTRAADVASVNTLSPWYNATEGTLYFEGSHSNSANFPVNVMFSDATVIDNQIILYTTSTASTGETLFVRAGNVVQANINGGGIVANNVTFKLGGAYKTNDFAVSLNGGSAVTDTSGSVPTVNRMFIGSSVNQNGYWLNGHIRRISYFPRRLSNVELQAITA